MMEGLHDLLGLNLNNASRKIYLNPGSDFLIKKTLEMGQGVLAKTGALVIKTGSHTGRAAKDKYVVLNSASKEKIWWENNINQMTPENFLKLRNRVVKYLNENRDLFIAENSVGAHPKHNLGVRVISERPAAALFSSYLFRKIERPFSNKSDFHVLHAPLLDIDPQEFGLKSKTVITTCFETNTTIIIGTLYAGEIKKSMFSVLNFILPDMGTFPMHAGANEGPNGDVSLFFGLSGTGKTTLSTDEDRKLIGDDEHGLSDEGVFNFEGGCYAKTYKLSKENEPDIWEATNRPGALLENVIVKENGEIDFNDKSISENGRSSYPLDFIKNIKPSANGGMPQNIFFLSADAFGCLPPVAKLNKKQAMYYFVLGYTAKLAGTEIGVVEPSATFSPCFGAPFMIRHPKVYAKLLGQYVEKYNIQVWLINTGWSGGPYGVGERFPIKITRAIIRSIQKTGLKDFAMKKDPIFGLEIPNEIPGVDSSALNPRNTWKSGEEYDKKASELAKSFETAMSKFGSIF